MCELTVTMRERSVVTMRSSSRPGQREVAEVVGGHLQLEAVRRLAVRRAHHARVVDEEVEAGVLRRGRASAARRTETRSDRSRSSSSSERRSSSLSSLSRARARLLLVRGTP